MNNKTLQYIKYYSLLSASIYFTVYMIRAFCIWDFTHPFQWIIDIPKMDTTYRTMLLFYWMIYIVVKNAITIGLIKRQK